jgi:hypothetical protein
MAVKNTIIVAGILMATAAVSIGVYRVGPYQTPAPEPEFDELAGLFLVSAQWAPVAPVDRARYEAKKKAADAKIQEALRQPFNPRVMIPEVVVRPQMLAAEWGRLPINVPAGHAAEFLVQVTHRYRVYWFQPAYTIPEKTFGPLKGTFTYDEAFDEALKGTGCTWEPSLGEHVIFDCGLGT